MILQLSEALLNKLGLLILFGFLLTKTSVFKGYVVGRESRTSINIAMAIVWGLLGVLMTLWGTPIFGGIANSRTIPVVLAGIIGGPIVGGVAGFIAGFHRMFLTVGGELTAISCGISTFIGGLIGGFLRPWILSKDKKWWYGFLIGVFVEAIQMLIILLVARPFDQAWLVVENIFFPMTFLNAVGIAVFLLFIEQVIEENDIAGAKKAQMALRIASKTLPILRKGLTAQTANETAKTIFDHAEVAAVSITNCDDVLAFVGMGADHHGIGRAIRTTITKETINDKQIKIARSKSEIECNDESCQLRSVVVVPLLIDTEVVGTLKLYKERENAMTSSEIELAKGLGDLFSTQLALSQIEEQEVLLQKAELRALRAQIRPHFLFNALNTIMALIRIEPEKARSVLSQLSTFLRSSFKSTGEKVTLRDELALIDAYVSVEKARFEERLEVIKTIDADLELVIPPFILQPIVENAIKHGLLKKQEGGVLLLTVKQEGDMLYCEVKDNGVGIDPTILQALQSGNYYDGVGVSNVMKRLKSGYDCNMTIESILGEGSKVSFTIAI